MKNNINIMKTNKLLNMMLVALAVVTMTACVQDDDFTIPNSLGQEENAGLQELLNDGTASEVSIADLKLMYDNDPNNDGDNDDAIPFEVDTNIYIKGYVSSSDRTGNFYKEIYIQDNFENPTAAIKVIINQNDLYNKYNKGREVYIKLQGLFVGEERTGNNVVTIGGGTETDQFGTTVTSLGMNQTNSSLFRSNTTMDLVPLSMAFNAVSDANIGMYAQFDGVEFADDLNGETYFDPTEDFDTERIMQACGGFSYSTFVLETSSFSNFKNELLPTGNGSIAGIITKNYFGDMLLMALNTTDDVNFNDARCTLLDINDFNVSFDENFDSQGAWEVTNTVGTRDWYNTGFGGENYMRGSAYDGGDIVEMVSWLISPTIDFDAQNEERLILEIADAFSNGQPLKAYYSNDYTAGSDPDTATWVEIGAAEISALAVNTGFFDNNYEETDLIDISMITGNAVLAFVYDSNNATVSTTIDLSNVKILSQ
jgi:hypothetical protein